MGNSHTYRRADSLFGIFLLCWHFLLAGSIDSFALTRDPSRFFFFAIATFSAIEVVSRFSGAILARRLEKYLWRRRAIGLSCCAMSVGATLLCFGHLLPIPYPVSMIAGSCLSAAGAAFCFGVWVKCTSLLSNNATMQEVTFAFLAASVAVVLFFLLPPALTVYTLVVLPIGIALASLCSISAAQLILPECAPSPDDSARAGVLSRGWIRDIALLSFGAFCYGLAAQFTRSEGWSGGDVDAVGGTLMFHQVGIAASALILYLLSWLASLERRSVLNDGIGGPAAIILTVGTLVPVFSSSFVPYITSAIVGSGIGLIEIILMFYSIALTGRSHMPALLSVGITGGAMALASLLGQLLRAFIDTGQMEDGQTGVLVATGIVVVLFAVCILAMNPSLRRLFLSLEESVIDEGGFSPDLVTASEPDPCDEDGQAGMKEKSSLLFEQKGLTPRETEVAQLLMLGRSLPYIEEELCISHGTANTHLRHIYDKLGVHNRQEFLSLVRGVE